MRCVSAPSDHRGVDRQEAGAVGSASLLGGSSIKLCVMIATQQKPPLGPAERRDPL
jgi:hypothetical protein